MTPFAVVKDHNIYVCDSYYIKDKLKAIPGSRFWKSIPGWVFPASPASALAILEQVPGIATDSGFKSLVMQATINDQADRHKRADDAPEIPVWLGDSWAHQRKAFWWAADRDTAVFNIEMGGGKTAIAAALTMHRGFKRTLIVCPPQVIEDHVWPRALASHVVNGTNVLVCELPAGVALAKRIKQADTQLKLANAQLRQFYLVVNYEAFWRPKLRALIEKAGFDAVIWDEIHKLKTPGGAASMAARALSRKIPVRYGLTGTLMPHSPMDAYAVFRAVDEGIFGTSFVRFRSRYAVMGGFEGKQIVGYQNEAELSRMIDSATFTAGEEILDLPDALHIERHCNLSPQAESYYKSLARDLFVKIDGGFVTPSNAMVALLRLRQLSSGYLPLDNPPSTPGSDTIYDHTSGRWVKRVDSSKESLLEDTLDGMAADEPVVVFCVFHHDLDAVHRVAAKLGRKSLELSGRRKELAAWKSGDAPVFAVQIQSGGIGIDLTRARYCILYSIDFNLGNYLQALRRIHRPGQTRPVTYYHLLARNTVDITVRKALQRRRNIIEEVMTSRDKVWKLLMGE